MKSFKPKRNKKGPEDVIRGKIIDCLHEHGWYTKIMHGNRYMAGVPDVYSVHPEFGPRWIEVKLPGLIGSRFTKAQKKNFPKMIEYGDKIWILTSEDEYDFLFMPYNLWDYRKELEK